MTVPTDPVSTTLSARGVTYGDFGKVAETAQGLLRVLKDTQRPVCNVPNQQMWDFLSSTQREALQMICTKLARILNGDPNHIDSWHDIAGYATLVEMELGKDVRVPNTAPGGVTYVNNKVDPK